MDKKDEILLYWFGNIDKNQTSDLAKQKMWFTKSENTDQEIKKNFAEDVINANNGNYDSWKQDADSSMALVILLDQFTRNIYRNTPESFSGDPKALNIAIESINNGFDKMFHPIKRFFFYMPFEHSEDIEMQKQSLKLFNKLMHDSPDELKSTMSGFKDYAQKHYDVIERFGRFPHRNKILGRESTIEEIEFLKQPNSSF